MYIARHITTSGKNYHYAVITNFSFIYLCSLSSCSFLLFYFLFIYKCLVVIRIAKVFIELLLGAIYILILGFLFLEYTPF
jgi:hypothetical protein